MALATGRLPSEWAAEDPGDIATTLVLMREQAREREKARRAAREGRGQ